MLAKLRKGKKLEWFSLLVFVAGYIVITCFHEPWFDEAQAWQIAKCASLKEILFKIPHYEGHPPLWHLILAIPAKLGVPYELGLKSVGFAISLASACLILFRSPYPRIVRLLLPFNFFLFYQYGVIVRPYGLMVLLLLLLAVCFPTRDSHPWRFTGVLMLLCLTHSYGIMIAGGVAVCLVWDLLKEKGFKTCFRELFRDSRTLALGALLVLAILIILEILPRSDTYTPSFDRTVPVWKSLLCMYFSSLSECLFLRSEWFYIDRVLIQTTDFTTASLISSTLVGCFVWLAVVCLASKSNLKYMVVPFGLFASFGGIVYMMAHHMGVGLGVLLFWLWIDMLDADRFHYWKRIQPILLSKQQLGKGLRLGFTAIMLICLLVPIYWSVCSSVGDLTSDYNYGRSVVAFLKETGLEDALIFCGWDYNEVEDQSSIASTDTAGEFVVPCSDPTIVAYFDSNIIANGNNGDDHLAYKEHRVVDRETYISICKSWAQLGIPEVIIGYGDLEPIYGDAVSMSDYTIVKIIESKYYYKSGVAKEWIPIYVRNDLLEQYGLEAADTNGYLLPYYKLTASMIASYQSGEMTIEDILDATIGDYGKAE